MHTLSSTPVAGATPGQQKEKAILDFLWPWGLAVLLAVLALAKSIKWIGPTQVGLVSKRGSTGTEVAA